PHRRGSRVSLELATDGSYVVEAGALKVLARGTNIESPEPRAATVEGVGSSRPVCEGWWEFATKSIRRGRAENRVDSGRSPGNHDRPQFANARQAPIAIAGNPSTLRGAVRTCAVTDSGRTAVERRQEARERRAVGVG